MSERKELDALAGAYVLDALEPDDRAAFEARLAQSAALRIEVSELAESAGMLGLAVAPIEPSSSARAAILAAIDTAPQGAAIEAAGVDAAADGAPGGAAGEFTRTAPDRDRESSADRRARSRWFRGPVAVLTAVAASVALIVGGGVVAGQLTRDAARMAQADHLAALMAAEDSTVSLGEAADGMTAKLVWSHELASSAILVTGLDAPPPGMTYQLWYIGESGPRPAGTMSPSGADADWRVLEGSMSAGDMVGVTVEPMGGSTAPSSDPILVVGT